jgi:hypothetical protein
MKTKNTKKHNIFKSKSNLSKREKRYCRCIIKLNTKGIKNPYGICTNSVYNLQNKKRTKVVKCSKNYDLNKLTLKQLRYYAKKKNINYSKIKKDKLISLLKKKM